MSESATELEAFRVEVSNWLKDNTPKKPDFLLPESFMEIGTDQQFEFLRNWQRKVYEAGYLGIAWPKEYGGGGKSQNLQNIVNEEMARQRVPFVPNTIGLSWAGPLILHQGTEKEKQKYIKNILNAEDIWCQGFSEPDHGSDLGNVQCKAQRDGDDYRINGSKIWTTLAAYANYMILLARTFTDGKNKYAGLSYFLSPMKVPGIEVQPIRKLTGEFGFCQVFFDDARIPLDCIMGREGEGWQVAMTTLMFERGATGGQAGGLSMMDLKINDVLELAKRARRNGKPALDDPLIRDELVQLLIEARGNQLMVARANFPALVSERPTAIAMSGKVRNTELKRRMTQFALSLQGANGSRYVSANAVDGGKWQRSYFNSFSATIGGGTSQVQKNILGERVLGLAKS